MNNKENMEEVIKYLTNDALATEEVMEKLLEMIEPVCILKTELLHGSVFTNSEHSEFIFFHQKATSDDNDIVYISKDTVEWILKSIASEDLLAILNGMGTRVYPHGKIEPIGMGMLVCSKKRLHRTICRTSLED